MKVVTTLKSDFTPDGQQVVVSSHDVCSTERISGMMIWPFCYDCKYQRIRYIKLFFDLDRKKLLGRKNEVQPWEEVCDLDVEVRKL